MLSPDGNLAVYFAATGRLEHMITAVKPWKFYELHIVGDRVYAELNTITTTSGDQIAIAAYNLATGAQIWWTVLDAGSAGYLSDVYFTSTAVVIVPGSSIGSGLIEAVSTANGKVAWSLSPGLCHFGFPVAASETAVYVVQCLGKDQSALEAIRPSDGRVLWHARTFREIAMR